MKLRPTSCSSLLLVVMASTGCTLFNQPDRSKLDAHDGGMNGDAAMDADAGEGGAALERCGNGVDDDGDGFVDCEDRADCGGDPACCEAMDEDFSCPDPSGAPWCHPWRGQGWDDVGTGAINGMGVLRLGATNDGLYVSNGCLPLAKGARIEVRMGMETPAACAPGACRAAMVLTAAANPLRSRNRFYEDLGVEYVQDEGGWAIRITQGGRVLLRHPVETMGNALTVEVSVGPAVDASGASVLAATVRLDPASRAEEVVHNLPFVRNTDLLPDCVGGSPGLRLALEGSGDARFEQLRFGERQCANPTLFESPRDAKPLCLPAPDGGLPDAPTCIPLVAPLDSRAPRWAVEDGSGPGAATSFGVLLHPALASFCDGASCAGTSSEGPWLAAVDVTDADPSLGLLGRIGFATETFRLGDARWNTSNAWSGVEGDAPALGGTNPTCLPDEMCAQSDPSVGHPSLLLLPSGASPNAGFLAVEAEGETNQREIHVFSLSDPTGPGVSTSPRLRFCPLDATSCPGGTTVSSCLALHTPLLLPPVGFAAGLPRADLASWNNQAWLLFSCEEKTRGTTLRAVALDLLTSKASEAFTVRTATGANEEALHIGGLVDLGGEVEFVSEERALLRLWTLTTDPRTGRRRLSLFEGVVSLPATVPSNLSDVTFPTLRPYPVTPLTDLSSLRAASSELDAFCSTGRCRLEGFDVAAVAKPADAQVSATTLRFLFAVRRGLQTRLFPFEQQWPVPVRGSPPGGEGG